MNEHEHRDHVHYRPDWLGTLPGLRTAAPWQTELSFTLPYEDQAYVMSLFHGGPRWLWEVRLAWGRCATPPISRGTAWRTGADAACQHQLTEPPEPPRPQFPRTDYSTYPQWYRDRLVHQIRRAYAERPELFNPAAWRTGDWGTDLTASQLAEQPAQPVIRLYDRNWNLTTVISEGVYAPPRTVTSDYPPPAEPCAECVAATTPMRTWVQQWWLRFAELLTYSHANQPPRTDFMPQYPGIGNQTGR